MVDGQETVIEVRTYRARAGQRERLMALMRELTFPVQRRLGMRVLGPLPHSMTRQRSCGCARSQAARAEML
jgi:hypothetical protein